MTNASPWFVLLRPEQQLLLMPRPPGSEWLEVLIATGKRYAVPRMTGGADLFDGVITVKSLSLAMQRCERLRGAYAEMTAAQQEAVWMDPSEEMAVMRRAVSR